MKLDDTSFASAMKTVFIGCAVTSRYWFYTKK